MTCRHRMLTRFCLGFLIAGLFLLDPIVQLVEARISDSRRSERHRIDGRYLSCVTLLRRPLTDPGQGNPTLFDPVDTILGEYLHRTMDLYLGGPLPLAFARYFGNFAGDYASNQGFYERTESPMGTNWVHNLMILFSKVGANNVTIHFDEGYVVSFSRVQGVWGLVTGGDHYKGLLYRLVEEGPQFRLMDPDTQLIYTFDTAGLTGTSIKVGVKAIQDRNGNTLAFSYNSDGTLARVIDGLGRSLEFSYVSSGGKPRVAKVTDPAGRFVQFTYSGAELRSSTDARNRTTTYTYNAQSRLGSIQRPAGNTPVRNTYDSEDRVVSQLDGLGNLTTLKYETTATTLTDPLGNVRRHEFNNLKRFLRNTDEASKSASYDYDSLNRKVSIVDRIGDRSGITYDAASGKVASRTDNEGKTWRYGYTVQAQDGFTFYDLARIDFPDGTNEQFAYDTRGNVLRRIDRAGKTWQYTYNPRGQILTSTNPAGGVTRFTYNSDGTMASLQEPSGETAGKMDSSGMAGSQRFQVEAGGSMTAFGYDEQKRVNRITRADGTTRLFGYDASDNLLSHKNEKGQTSAYTYDENGNLKTFTNPLGKKWTLDYDANDNLNRVVDPLAQVTQWTYDSMQRVKAVADPNGNQSIYIYDARGRITATVDGEGKTWALGYDDEGVLTSFTNPLGRTWRYTSDKQGRIRSISDPLSNETRFEYDVLSRLTSLANPLNETATFGYDPRGFLTRVSLPSAVSAAYTRDDLGRVTRVTDPRGDVWSWAFDNLGRLISSSDAAGRGTRLRYDRRNRPSQIELPAGTVDLAYDGVGLLTALRYSDGTRLDYGYDDANRLMSANGVTLGYDDAHRIVSANGMALSRDGGGRITAMALEPGKTITYTYDRRNLLSSVSDWAQGIVRFGYDEAGRLTSVRRPNGVVTTYSYDAADRLAGIVESLGQTTLSSIALTRDGVGQIKEAARSVPLDPAPAQGTRSHDYSDASQIAGYTYDALGRLTAGGGRTYVWDLASRLTSYTEGQGAVSFTYDAFGNRSSRSQGGATRSYVWNYALGLPSISIVKDDGIATRYYVHSPGGSLLYSVEASGNARRFYHYDEIGSTLFLTDDNGAITDSYAYNAYGQLSGATGTSDNPFTYVGRYGVMREPSTSLYYMRARYYDSSTARFLSRDPLGINLLDPRSANLYQYAAGNPLRYLDPAGQRITLEQREAARGPGSESGLEGFGDPLFPFPGRFTAFKELFQSLFEPQSEEPIHSPLQVTGELASAGPPSGGSFFDVFFDASPGGPTPVQGGQAAQPLSSIPAEIVALDLTGGGLPGLIPCREGPAGIMTVNAASEAGGTFGSTFPVTPHITLTPPGTRVLQTAGSAPAPGVGSVLGPVTGSCSSVTLTGISFGNGRR